MKLQMLRMSKLVFLAMILSSLLIAGPQAQGSKAAEPLVSQSSVVEKPVNVDEIIRRFTAKETEFRQALSDYAFTRDATVQTIGMGGQITGEYHRTSQFVFNGNDERFEKITFFPQPTLTEIAITQEDLEDLGGVEPFALEASKINLYNFTYVGKERLDELDTYVFDVAPKMIPKKVSERFFQGRIWVDQQDVQIVKVKGKGVPEGDQRFPIFETYRQQVDGHYWFPVYTYSDDQLDFPKGNSVHLRMLVRYTDFKRFRSKVRITDVENQEEIPSQPTPTPAPTPKKP
jgi:hypothetical protein